MPNPTLNLTTPEVEAADAIRGHAFYPPADVLATIPGLYDTEDISYDDKVLHLHYFVGGADWYIAELDQETGEAFGWAQLVPDGGEWGYIYLPELATLEVRVPFPLLVDRDCWYTPTTAREALARFAR